MSFFAAFDLLKLPIFLLYKGQNSLSTHMGQFLTLGLLVLLINSSINSDFFKRENPGISVQTDYAESFGRLELNNSNFTVAVKIANYYGSSIVDFSYFYFTMDFNFADPQTETISMDSKFMRLCQDSDFEEEDRKLNLAGKAFCPSQEGPLILVGSVSSPSILGYGIIHAKRCDNQSEIIYNVTCKSSSEIDVFFQDKLLYLYYTNNKFDLTNLNSPIRRTLDNHVSYFYPKIKKTTGITVQKTLISTDSSIFNKFCRNLIIL